MAKKQNKKAKKKSPQGSRPAPAKKSASYSPAEIAMAVLGAALLVLFAGIVITSIFGSG
jgi:hypothetical protein